MWLKYLSTILLSINASSSETIVSIQIFPSDSWFKTHTYYFKSSNITLFILKNSQSMFYQWSFITVKVIKNMGILNVYSYAFCKAQRHLILYLFIECSYNKLAKLLFSNSKLLDRKFRIVKGISSAPSPNCRIFYLVTNPFIHTDSNIRISFGRAIVLIL